VVALSGVLRLALATVRPLLCLPQPHPHTRPLAPPACRPLGQPSGQPAGQPVGRSVGRVRPHACRLPVFPLASLFPAPSTLHPAPRFPLPASCSPLHAHCFLLSVHRPPAGIPSRSLACRFQP
jgi:hypothetical protein